MTPVDALCIYGGHLSEYEQDEILDHPEVWYVGEGAQKLEAVRGAPQNGGFDDQSGRYLYRYLDHVAYRYKLMEPLGKGAFGDCLRAYDYKLRRWVALKIIKNEPRYHRQGKVEVNVLELLRRNDQTGEHSLVHMIDSLIFRNHLVITFELLGTNLYSALRARGFSGFEQPTIQAIAADILRCLKLLRTLDVVHADLKPENILLRGNPVAPADEGPASVAKVIDFGSSCFRHGRIHTYVQSRYYRAPEIVLGLGYGPACDMWSLGCILYELDAGHPLFGAKNERDLVLMQAELLGAPQQRVLDAARRASEFFDSAGRPLRTTDRKGRVRLPGARPLREALKCTDSQFADFISRCLTWDQKERMTPAEAIAHPWVQGSAVSGRPQHLMKQALTVLTEGTETLANTLSG